MIIDTAKYTNNGGHEINEDSIFCRSDLFIVADGLGGHYGGENASAAAVSYLSEKYHGDISETEIMQLLEGANNAVNELNTDSHTTVAAAFVYGNRMRIANVGDSRVYIFRNNKVHKVTKDHSVCQVSVEMGEMSYEEIRFSDDRSRLLKVLGNGGALNLKTKYDPIELQDGDAFLLCSDGFWEYVHEREMEADLLKADSAESWKRLMLKRQILRAKNQGDNYSVICGIVHAENTPVVTPLPATVALNTKEDKPIKNKNFFWIFFCFLIFVAIIVAFWFMGGNKLWANAFGSESNDSSISETTDFATSETTEPLPDESEEQSAVTTTEPVINETIVPDTSETAESLPDESEESL